MSSRLTALRRFLDAHLGPAGGSIEDALRDFSADAGPSGLAELRHELQGVLSSSPIAEEFLLALTLVGEQRPFVSEHPFGFLTKLYRAVQLALPIGRLTKPFQVFIAHSYQDRATATRLGFDLKRVGFKVWLDETNTESPDAFRERVLRLIRDAEFIVVLISRNSLDSPWAHPELHGGILAEIQRQDVAVMWALLEPYASPASLGANVVDLTSDWDEGVRELLENLESLRSRRLLSQDGVRKASGEAGNFGALVDFYHAQLTQISQVGWLGDEAFKDVAIGPRDESSVKIPKPQLLDLVNDCRVSLQNWGGTPFPCRVHPRTHTDLLPDGVRVYESGKWRMADWWFVYWKMADSGHFMQRQELGEDHLLDDAGKPSFHGLLSLEWALKDVCSPLMFAFRLIGACDLFPGLHVRYHWGGLRNRQLVLLNHTRVPLLGSYRSSADEFNSQVTITSDSDLRPIAESIVGDLLWQFQWERYPREVIREQIDSLLSGVFPL